MDDDEKWLPIPGTDGFYEASSWGRVRSWKRPGRLSDPTSRRAEPLVLAKSVDSDGYQQVSLAIDGKKKQTHKVHRLVALTFIEGEPSLEVAHADGNRANNWPGNLRWATHAENESDKVTHGTLVRGEGIKNAKLTERDVREIRRLREAGVPVWELAERYGIHRVNMSHVVNRKAWAHVD